LSLHEGHIKKSFLAKEIKNKKTNKKNVKKKKKTSKKQK